MNFPVSPPFRSPTKAETIHSQERLLIRHGDAFAFGCGLMQRGRAEPYVFGSTFVTRRLSNHASPLLMSDQNPSRAPMATSPDGPELNCIETNVQSFGTRADPAYDSMYR